MSDTPAPGAWTARASKPLAFAAGAAALLLFGLLEAATWQAYRAEQSRAVAACVLVFGVAFALFIDVLLSVQAWHDRHGRSGLARLLRVALLVAGPLVAALAAVLAWSHASQVEFLGASRSAQLGGPIVYVVTLIAAGVACSLASRDAPSAAVTR